MSNMDPGPVPATVEPQAVEQVLVVDRHTRIGVIPYAGMVVVAVEQDGHLLTTALSPATVDELCSALAKACPIEALPGWEDSR